MLILYASVISIHFYGIVAKMFWKKGIRQTLTISETSRFKGFAVYPQHDATQSDWQFRSKSLSKRNRWKETAGSATVDADEKNIFSDHRGKRHILTEGKTKNILKHVTQPTEYHAVRLICKSNDFHMHLREHTCKSIFSHLSWNLSWASRVKDVEGILPSPLLAANAANLHDAETKGCVIIWDKCTKLQS